MNNFTLKSFRFIAGFIFLLIVFSCSSQVKPVNEKNSKTWFYNQQQPDGSICEKENRLFDVWETVNALLAVLSLNPGSSSDPEFKKAMEFVIQNMHPSGLICHNQKCKSSWCVETSALFLNLVSHSAFNDSFTETELADTLSKLKPGPDGLFDIHNPDVGEQPFYPSATGLLLSSLDKTGEKSLFDSVATQALLSSQKTDGSWGFTWEYYGCPAYAMWAILPALNQPSRRAVSVNAVEKARTYIASSFIPGEGWNFKMNDSEYLPSSALQTALMLQAGFWAGMTKKDNCIQEGLRLLTEKKLPDGSWNGGYFPIPQSRKQKHESVFATAQACIALNLFSEK